MSSEKTPRSPDSVGLDQKTAEYRLAPNIWRASNVAAQAIPTAPE